MIELKVLNSLSALIASPLKLEDRRLAQVSVLVRLLCFDPPFRPPSGREGWKNMGRTTRSSRGGARHPKAHPDGVPGHGSGAISFASEVLHFALRTGLVHRDARR